MENTEEKQVVREVSDMHPSVQFLVFAAIFVGTFFVGNLIGAGIIFALYGLKTFTAIAELNTTAPHFIPAVWILQITGTTVPIFLAPLLFARFVVNNITDYIKPAFKSSWVLMGLVLIIMFASSPVMEWLSNINQKMVLPPYLHWMRESEDSAQKLTTALLHMNGFGSMLFNLIFIGLFTAIAEEFMFRGCLQTIFEKLFKNTHVAIWITAVLFSAFHMEFFGFLPRLMLGVLFGYFAAYSGSIWPAVWGHFINNGTAVVVTYLYQQKMTSISPDDQHMFNFAGYIFSFIIILFLFWVYHKVATNKRPVQV